MRNILRNNHLTNSYHNISFQYKDKNSDYLINCYQFKLTFKFSMVFSLNKKKFKFFFFFFSCFENLFFCRYGIVFGTRSNSVWPFFGLQTLNLNIFLDIWFPIRIEYQILNKMNTRMAIIIFISKKYRPKYSKTPVWPVRPVGNRFLVWIFFKQI
jgi:hypothetical protein